MVPGKVDRGDEPLFNHDESEGHLFSVKRGDFDPDVFEVSGSVERFDSFPDLMCPVAVPGPDAGELEKVDVGEVLRPVECDLVNDRPLPFGGPEEPRGEDEEENHEEKGRYLNSNRNRRPPPICPFSSLFPTSETFLFSS